MAITSRMTQRQQSVEPMKKDFVTQVSMRQNSVENQKRRQYTQQNSVLLKLMPYITNRINVLIAVLLLSILINVGLVLGFVFMFIDQKGNMCHEYSASNNQKESLCLPCRVFFENHNTVNAYSSNSRKPGHGKNYPEMKFDSLSMQTSDKNEKMCCVDMRTGLEYLLEKMPGEQQRVVALQTTDPNCVSGLKKNETQNNPSMSNPPGPTVAHLNLDTSSLKGELLKWEMVSSIGGVKSDDLIYRNGILTIPKDGLFFVYCQITFYVILPEDRNIKPVPVAHNIIDKRDHTTEILLQNKLGLSSDTLKESYLGAVLNLKKGDELFVSVSNSSFVYPYYLTNMFGLYQVSV